jgi:hypothetical protein
MLKWLGLSTEGNLEEALYAAGLFFATLQLVMFVMANFGWLRRSVIFVALSAAAIAAGRGWLQLPKLARAFVSEVRKTKPSFFVGGVLALVVISLLTDALMAMAPLTGSDAMAYHFTVPWLELGGRWQPTFWLVQSFYVAQGHMLIRLGMVLGSDRVSLGLVYLGGVFAAAALYELTRRLASVGWAWVAVLTFVLTPMVFWQMSISGAPDIWMAFHTTLALLALVRGLEPTERRWLCMAGFFAGTVASFKYTGWVVAAALVCCCFLATRLWKWSMACGLSSLSAGALGLVRNGWWTGDPFFPYLARWLTWDHFNAYSAAATLQGVRGAGFDRSIKGLIMYPFELVWKGEVYGVGHYFGPLVLAFAPLLVFAVRRGRLAHFAIVLWAAVFLSNAVSLQSARFLLPSYPLALALVFVGLGEAFKMKSQGVRAVSTAAIFVFVSFGAVSQALYARDFLPVAIGLEEEGAFLTRAASDYPAVSLVNARLKGQEGKAMVFISHVYYLRVPFMIGDPSVSWLIDPACVAKPQALLNLLHRENIRWVVKAPDYPAPLAPTFQALEEEGRLRPVFSGEVSTFSGFRVYGQRMAERVVILEVA